MARATKRKPRAKAPAEKPTDPRLILTQLRRVGEQEDTVGNFILQAIRNGADRRTAFEFMGVPYGTGRVWLQRGRQGDASFVTFVADFEAAESFAAMQMIQTVHRSGAARSGTPGDPKAALEWLKRRRKDEWGDKLEVSGTLAIGTFAQLAEQALSDQAEYDEAIEAEATTPPPIVVDAIPERTDDDER